MLDIKYCNLDISTKIDIIGHEKMESPHETQ